jgi:hypothetical protein
MELYQMITIAIALVNLAVTVWLLRLLLPVWRGLRQIVFALDNFDFDKLTKQFLNDQRPLTETIHVVAKGNKEEGYKEIVITRSFKKPLDAAEVREGIVRQMAQEMQ